MKRHNDIQQGADEWHHIRKGKITGTTLKAIMGTPKARKEALYEIVGERLGLGLEDEMETAIERGHRLEPDAISAFEFETGKKVDRTGFCEDDDNKFIANSPDGLIGDTEAAEVKCMGKKNHIKAWLTDTVPDEYWWQVVQYFVVNGNLKTLYFICYNPDIPTHQLHIIKVHRKDIEGDIEDARREQEGFLTEVDTILSNLITL